MEWRLIEPLDGFDGLCYRIGEFVVASRWEEKDYGPTQFVWELFQVSEDGTFAPLRVQQHIVSEGRDQHIGGHLERAKLMVEHAIADWRSKHSSTG